MKIAVMGCGVVGSGVVEICDNKAEMLGARCGADTVEVKYILDIRDFTGHPYAPRVISDINTIINDDEIAAVAETMGGTEPAFSYCMACLNAGKAVVTSNKELVANKGDELLAAAKANNVSFRFEAAVCGGIPVLNSLFTDLAANRISSLCGILNGTTNFILTSMIKEGAAFEDALKTAQDKGYAERNPAADIEGIDACRKTAILTSIMTGSHIYPQDIPTKGITRITLDDARAADRAGCAIKLLGASGYNADGSVSASVQPRLVKKGTLLAATEGVFNALLAKGDSVGEVLFYGPGAGKEATASAVCGDILQCLRANCFEGHYFWEKSNGRPLAAPSNRWFVRGILKDNGSIPEEVCDGDIADDGSEVTFFTPVLSSDEAESLLASAEGFELISIIAVL